MSKILKIEHELCLTYSWSSNNHGICGHTYEVIEYYMVLKNHFSTCILLAEDITIGTFLQVIEDKYDFTEEEIIDIIANTIFNNRPTLVQGQNILFTDGGIRNTKNVTLLFKKVFYFACGNKNIVDIDEENVYVLFDIRVYDFEEMKGVNYKKRILFDRFKKIETKVEDTFLVYGTKNCRAVGDSMIQDIQKKYKNVLVLTQENSPYENLFENFNTYIYTPVPRKFDCSPRLVAECAYFGKEVIYHNIDYWKEDLGLSWRQFDITANFDSLFLREDDSIIRILKERINDEF